VADGSDPGPAGGARPPSATQASYDYDVYGRLMGGKFERVSDLGYTGKKVDPVTGWYNSGYRDYSPMTMRFTTTDPIRSGSNWYAYVNGDPVNYVDPLGLDVANPGRSGFDCPNASDNAAGNRPGTLDPTDVITSANPLNQLQFEERYGYGSNGVRPGVSCQTVAMVNAYACDTSGGVRVSDLDRAVEGWEERGEIETTGTQAGSVGDWAGMSQTLARELGRETYLEFRYPGGQDHPETASMEQFGSSGASLGIAHLTNSAQRTQHWVLITLTQMIDSLDPQRPTASGYTIDSIQLLQTLRLP
jgi:RHS repeat-associated protein